MGLPGHERDLARLASAARRDHFLESMPGLAEAGSTYVLGLVVAGMTVYGRTTTELPLAELFDAEIEKGLAQARAAASDPRDWDEAERVVKGAWTRRVNEEREQRVELIGRLSGRDFDELEETEQREAITERPDSLTLADARVFQPGVSSAVEVPVLRIALAHVAAWWLIPTGEDGVASFSHPS